MRWLSAKRPIVYVIAGIVRGRILFTLVTDYRADNMLHDHKNTFKLIIRSHNLLAPL